MTIVKRMFTSVMATVGMLTSFALIPILVTSLTGCSSRTSETDAAATEPELAPVEESSVEDDRTVDEETVIDTFADSYDAASQTPLTLSGSFVPHDSNGERYRTEYRLGAFSDAVGKTYTDGGMSVDMVVYGTNSGWGDNDDFRVYAEGPTDQVAEFYRIAYSILDPDVSPDDIDKAVNSELEFGYTEGSVMGSGLQSAYFNATGETSECMLDSRDYVKEIFGEGGR